MATISDDRTRNVYGATLSRRQFVKAGGALLVGVSMVGKGIFDQTMAAAASKNSLDATLSRSWFEIHADNTILMRTGKVDFGQSSAHTAYKQLAAEELNVSFDAITAVVMGDTDRTPDGGFSAGFLEYGGVNVRKAAAYTYQALLDLAATKLGVEKAQLSVKDGVVSGGGKSISYGELVRGQELSLSIPVSGDLTNMLGLTVTGNPPMKPTTQYTVIGKSFMNTVTPSKVMAKEVWVTDVRLPDMLHGRIVHPKTLGSTLVSAGTLNKTRFPNARVVVKGNLVGVVAPTEWEAIGASQQVAADTKWTDWKGLPGHANLHAWMREQADWKSTPVANGEARGSVTALDATAGKSFSASYELPFMKHAPIGPTIAVGDARTDGTFHIHTHNQNPQALRGQIAMMLGTSVDNVVVRIYAGPGHYGRSNGGNAGAEDEAILLSQAVGKPVRVQWMRAEDLQWSTQSPPGLSDIRISWDETGKMTGYKADHYMPAMQDDRLVGALLAGLPTPPAPEPKPQPGSFFSTVNAISDPWIYERVSNVAESGHGTFQIGQQASPLAVGLRDHSMRTPGQLQQNYPRELAISEAAAQAGIDAIEFRLKQTADARLIGVLTAVREASGWKTRRSPSQKVATGSTAVTGQGISAMLRSGTYWACVCQVSVVPGTGKVTVDKYTIAVDPGIVVNPLQLKRTVEGGALMGLSHALYEEMTFDESGVTSRDWRSYPILTMADVPEVKVVILPHPEVGAYGGGSEAANALAVSAIAAAFYDATGVPARRLPLRPAYVQSVLRGAEAKA